MGGFSGVGTAVWPDMPAAKRNNSRVLVIMVKERDPDLRISE
jgi:hypothetical protein